MTKIKYRKRTVARIYKPCDNYPRYRLAWTVGGKRHMKAFARFSEAKKFGEDMAEDLYKGKANVQLSPGQAADALAAYERLSRHRQTTGREMSLLGAITTWCESDERLNGKSVSEAIDGYLSTVAVVKRKDLAVAIEDFITARKLKTVANNGKRPQLSKEHHYNTSIWLREFAKTFPGSAVCDLGKAHMALYMEKHSKAAPKTRNERRGVVKMFLQWAVEQDYLNRQHRLLESSALAHETADPETIELYTADELRALLERASKQPKQAKKNEPAESDYRELMPVIALAGLAGMRFKEILRLTFEDVFRVPAHIEVKAHKSKTRSRRLIEMGTALAGWLEAYRNHSGLVWSKSYDMLHIDFAALRKELKIKERRNGLRHSFISAHFAAHSDENKTAAQAGNSPDMIHKHYKGLLTQAEGKAWFDVAPERPANIIPITAAQAKS